jgi:hypothetical protein
MGDKKCIENLVAKPEGKRPLGRPRRRWENSSKIDLKETECEDVDWAQQANR